MTNIASLSNSTLINAAKNQLKDQAISSLKQTILSKTEEIEQDIEKLIKDKQNITKDYNNKIKLIQDSNISKEEKDKNIELLQQSRIEELKLKDEEIDKLKNDIKNSITDPLDLVKINKKKINDNINKSIRNTKINNKKANSQRNKQILLNTKKNLSSIISNQLTNSIVVIISQNSKLQKLVNKTNEIIDNADTEEKIQIAITSRNNAINIINNQELKVLSLQKKLKTISTSINIFQIVLTILSSLPIPVSTPPGVGIPLNVITKITNTIEKLTKLIEELNVILSIMIPTVESVIKVLEDLKNQLHNINGLIENKVSDNPSLLNLNFNSDVKFNEYKGFKFAIKEDETLGAHQKITVRGFKRHYAVAINRDDVEVLKSEYSFTLDPNDLVEQLKIIIDQQNLQA